MPIYKNENNKLVDYSDKPIIDTSLSDTSENAVQNKVITEQIAALTKEIEDAMALRASLETYGMVKLCDSSAVTDSTGLALPATEKNTSIDGTLANKISQLNTGLDSLNSNFLTSYKSVYVDATNGNDTTGDGSQENPWATIQKAVDECPICTVGRYEYRILLKPGTYDYGGNLYNLSTNITITGEDYSSMDKVDNTLIKGMINVNNCRMVTLQGLKIQNNDNAGVAVGGDSNIAMYYCKLDKCRINVDSGRLTASRCDISNYGHASLGAIHCQGGIINLSVITGTGNNIAMSCGVNGGDGGVIYAGVNCSISGKKITDYGGRIEFGSQGYQLIGSVTGANSVAIDSDLYTEFLVVQGLSGHGNYRYNISSLESDGITCKNGECAVVFNKTKITNTVFKVSGTDKLSTATMTVYGRRA